MNCEKISKEREGVANMAIDYCAGSLEPAQAAEFEHHLSECGDCTRVVAAQREVWESLGQLNVPEVSQDFDARLYARIAQEEAAPAWRKWLEPDTEAGDARWLSGSPRFRWLRCARCWRSG